MWTFPNLKTGSEEDGTRRLVALKKAIGKPCASRKSDCQGGPKAERTEWSRNLHVSPANPPHGSSILGRQGEQRTRI